ncbi:uncharacterized protein LOC128138025 isoform X2 [Harpia harpyja]|uniref:uncharacterized protein LOC128138025 isoform X2 n=1 Tax=Harpia harpyja TaxID=202280 RepID=UPI0022B1DE2F|nr:uncharacterized protein LOC128138025 isoform X2 [Harpia harpyja]XP_052635262.1 uncharacterized protein LOC128138025 isoform X2 [Harpia harpyja]
MEENPPNLPQNWYFGGWRSSGRSRNHPIHLKIGILVAGGAQERSRNHPILLKIGILVAGGAQGGPDGGEPTRFTSKLVFWWLEELREEQVEENPPDSPQNWYFGGRRFHRLDRHRGPADPLRPRSNQPGGLFRHEPRRLRWLGDSRAWWHGRHMSPVATERRKPTAKGEKKTPNEPKNCNIFSTFTVDPSISLVSPMSPLGVALGSLTAFGCPVSDGAQMTTINIWGATAQPIPEKRLQPTPVERAEACRTVARAVTVVGPSYFRGSLVVKATKKNTTRPDATARTRNNPSSPR